MANSQVNNDFITFLGKRFLGTKPGSARYGAARSMTSSSLRQALEKAPQDKMDVEDRLFSGWREEFVQKHEQVTKRLQENQKSLKEILEDIENLPPQSRGKKYPLWRMWRRVENALDFELGAKQLAGLGVSALVVTMLVVSLAPEKTVRTMAGLNAALFGQSAVDNRTEHGSKQVQVPEERLSSYVREFHNTRSILGKGEGYHGESVAVPKQDLTGRVAGASASGQKKPAKKQVQDLNFFEFVYRLFFRP